MKLKNIATLGTILLLSSFLLTACYQINKNITSQTTPVIEKTTEELDDIGLQATPSESTELNDLDQELTELEVLEEDFNDL